MTSSFMFIITIVCFSLMVFLTILSGYLYHRAKEINPELLTREDLLNDITKARVTIDKLDEDIKLKTAEKVEADRIISQADTLKKWIDANGGSVEVLRKQIDIAKSDYEEINKKLFDKETERDELLKEIVEYKKESDNLSININSSQSTLATLIEEISLKKQEKERLTTAIEQITKTLNLKNLELNDLKEQIREKQANLKMLDDKISGANSTISEIQSLKEEKNTIIRNLGKLKEDYANELGKDDSKNEIWSDLDREYIGAISKSKLKNNSEEDLLNKFSSLLNDNNIKFNPRTINAFHTGLKAEDSSPLVVLSGISGTGKSLLPKLYSDFMGFNFLATAVQPRWDSPQDMLGFYNYMQKKYKATELARLLWEFDIYNNEKCKFKDDKNQLPMNLVLLDEMNIARVEYYFSDMLSKLELRRTVDKSIDEHRVAAEIEIECGALTDKKFARKLFVNNNTLFVGTMNEDESTQVLSDKVIDRSNVIRFGKPDQLQSKANIIKFSNSCNDNEYLTYDIWTNNWCDNKKNKIPESLSESIENINTQLEKVGRPFGHRVWNSIENYIRLYPNGQNNYNDALADQIEMKILPKLNGLEMDAENADDVLNKIGEEIRKVKDEALINAYEKAKNDNSNVFFQWRGVVR